jgi:hypothetical protein
VPDKKFSATQISSGIERATGDKQLDYGEELPALLSLVDPWRNRFIQWKHPLQLAYNVQIN